MPAQASADVLKWTLEKIGLKAQVVILNRHGILTVDDLVKLNMDQVKMRGVVRRGLGFVRERLAVYNLALAGEGSSGIAPAVAPSNNLDITVGSEREEIPELAEDSDDEESDEVPAERGDEITEYMKPFMRFPIPKGERFNELLARWRNSGDSDAYNQLIYGNARLVLQLAWKRYGHGLSVLDMAQEGFHGMMHALEKFDPSRGNEFSTYATWWIKQAIGRAIHDFDERRPFRIPVHMQEKIGIVARAHKAFFEEHGRWPDIQETYLAIHTKEESQATKAELSISWSDVKECLYLINEGYLSLDSDHEHEKSGKTSSFESMVPDYRVNVEVMVDTRKFLHEYKTALKRIEAAIDQLGPRQAMILRLRLGLGEFVEMTLEEIGERYELTRERVRQIEAKAFEKLQEVLGLGKEEIEQIVAAADEVAKAASVSGIDLYENDGADYSKSGLLPKRVPVDELFRLLCQHVILTQRGQLIVKSPARTLMVRAGLLPDEASAALEQMREKNLVEGGFPWVAVRVVPNVPVPDYGARPETDDNKDDEVMPTPVIPTEDVKPKGKTRTPTAFESLTYRKVFETLLARASRISGERVVRGPALILMTELQTGGGGATELLAQLVAEGYITQRDGWRVVVLNHDTINRDDAILGQKTATDNAADGKSPRLHLVTNG